MKKLLPVTAIFFLALGACKKDRTCTCTVPASGQIKEQKYTYELPDSKKGKARRACQAAEEYYSLSAGSCELEK